MKYQPQEMQCHLLVLQCSFQIIIKYLLEFLLSSDSLVTLSEEERIPQYRAKRILKSVFWIIPNRYFTYFGVSPHILIRQKVRLSHLRSPEDRLIQAFSNASVYILEQQRDFQFVEGHGFCLLSLSFASLSHSTGEIKRESADYIKENIKQRKSAGEGGIKHGQLVKG